MQTAGYSGTPLAKKLGIKMNHAVYFDNLPKHYFTLFEDLPEVTVLESPALETADFIHMFATEKVQFEKRALDLKPLLKKNGMLWVSWPKGSSKIPTDLSENPIREYLLANGLVDVKVCAVDQDWSGLKFVYRLKDRG